MPRANAERNLPIVFLVDVDNTLLDNDRIKTTSNVTLSASSDSSAETASGRSRSNSSRSLATGIIWEPSNASASNTPTRHTW